MRYKLKGAFTAPYSRYAQRLYKFQIVLYYFFVNFHFSYWLVRKFVLYLLHFNWKFFTEKRGSDMDNLTKLVRDEITRQYRSVRQFAFAVDIPLSTINSALHNGVGGSSFDTVMRICKILGIKAMSDDAALYLTDDTEKLLTQYAKLDEYGRHTIASVMQVEYDRCIDME